MGEHVRDLSINNIDIDVQVILSLPALFPNITSLKWIEQSNCVRFTGDQAESIYTEALQNWEKIESIVDSTKQYFSTTSLLRSYTCKNLKQLDITFGDHFYADDGTDLHGRTWLELLMENIQQTPSLKQLALSDTVISLGDLEQLHDKLSKLQEIVLDDIYLNNNEEPDLAVINPAKSVKLFSLNFVSANGNHEDRDNLEQVITNWISYIGQKYKYIQQVEIYSLFVDDWQNFDFEEHQFLEQPLITALSNMKHINNYKVKIYPLTVQIQNIMDTAGIKLKNIKLVTLDEGQLFQLFQHSTSALTLEELELEIFDRFLNTAVLTHALFDNKLDHLTHITVHSDRRLTFLIAILQNLTELESLTWNCLTTIEATNKQVIDSLDEETIKQCALKSSSVGVLSHDEDYISTNRMNLMPSFILKSCPLLEQFQLSGRIPGR